MDTDYVMKICALGSGNVGKTSLIRRYTEGKFSHNYLPTLGVDITTKRIIVNHHQVKLILADTGGQEFFGKIRANYYIGALGCILVFTLNDRKSFNAVPSWMEEFRKIAKGAISIVLVGNKKDLVDERVVSREEAKVFAESKGMTYYETSALLGGKEIEKMFSTIASEIFHVLVK